MLCHPICFEGTDVCPISEFRTVIIFVITVELAHNGSWMNRNSLLLENFSSLVSASSHEDKMDPSNETRFRVQTRGELEFHGKYSARRFPIFFARFEVLTAVTAELSFSWNMTISRKDEVVL